MANLIGVFYLLLVALAVGGPIVVSVFKLPAPRMLAKLPLAAFFGFAGLGVYTALRREEFALAALALGTTVVCRRSPPLLAAVVGVTLFAPVPWWREFMTPRYVILTFAAAAVIILYRKRRGGVQGAAQGARPALSARSLSLAMIGAFVVGALMGLPTTPYASAPRAIMAWHHWGAYLAPVEAWLSGGAPYGDFPVQYGLGSTVLIAASCMGDCWRGLYWIAVFANALYFAALTGCALLLLERCNSYLRWAALPALFCATFLWTAFPVDMGTSVMTPAVAGLRFLPLVIVLSIVLALEARWLAGLWPGHLAWFAGFLWSPEIAGASSLVWWPYVLLRALDAGGRDASRAERWRIAVRWGMGAAAFLAAAVATLGGIVAIISKGRGSLEDFLRYIISPPGPWPANAAGPVWLGVAVIAGLALLVREYRWQRERLAINAVAATLVAVGSYYLSRSHDNNILNLFPFMVLGLIALAARMPAALASGSGAERSADFWQPAREVFSLTVLLAMIVFLLLADFSPWRDERGGLRAQTFGPDILLKRFEGGPDDSPGMLPRDATQALAHARANGAGRILLCTNQINMPRGAPDQWWTSVNNMANFSPLPPEVVRDYVQRGVRAYGKSGWIVTDANCRKTWMGIFAESYTLKPGPFFGEYQPVEATPRIR